MTGKKLKEIRLKLGLTQQEFGEAIGLSDKGAKVHICRMEKGVRPITKMMEVSILNYYSLMRKNACRIPRIATSLRG